MTCCSDCAWILKKEAYIKSCGSEHNFFSDSGITNIFQREDIKEKIKKYYLDNFGVTNITQTEQYYINKRKNGCFIPLVELTEFQIYKNNVISFTNFNLKCFGDEKFGIDWEKERDFFNKHVYHIFSIKDGYLKKIEPFIIGSIINLNLIPYKENLSKHDKSNMIICDLYEKYKYFETINKELIDNKIRIRKLYENKKNN